MDVEAVLDVLEHVLKVVVVIVNRDVILIALLIAVPHLHHVQVYVQVGVLAVHPDVTDVQVAKVRAVVADVDRHVLADAITDAHLHAIRAQVTVPLTVRDVPDVLDVVRRVRDVQDVIPCVLLVVLAHVDQDVPDLVMDAQDVMETVDQDVLDVRANVSDVMDVVDAVLHVKQHVVLAVPVVVPDVRQDAMDAHRRVLVVVAVVGVDRHVKRHVDQDVQQHVLVAIQDVLDVADIVQEPAVLVAPVVVMVVVVVQDHAPPNVVLVVLAGVHRVRLSVPDAPVVALVVTEIVIPDVKDVPGALGLVLTHVAQVVLVHVLAVHLNARDVLVHVPVAVIIVIQAVRVVVVVRHHALLNAVLDVLVHVPVVADALVLAIQHVAVVIHRAVLVVLGLVKDAPAVREHVAPAALDAEDVQDPAYPIAVLVVIQVAKLLVRERVH